MPCKVSHASFGNPHRGFYQPFLSCCLLIYPKCTGKIGYVSSVTRYPSKIQVSAIGRPWLNRTNAPAVVAKDGKYFCTFEIHLSVADFILTHEHEFNSFTLSSGWNVPLKRAIVGMIGSDDLGTNSQVNSCDASRPSFHEFQLSTTPCDPCRFSGLIQEKMTSGSPINPSAPRYNQAFRGCGMSGRFRRWSHPPCPPNVLFGTCSPRAGS